MSGFGFFSKHRTWEDWFGMLHWRADRGIAVVSFLKP